ncbi:FKBP-type peptidyl-prolyl cis-trans isomerase [Undibacterium griseum]|uniref:Peptidyl-prolyl cis-trans isomerase n=1 Tax=Undibacterium griseum TaxID=2762295 RepID=A0ABR6YQ59_9BURK|nr:peptidylprolyl isomerase [Undibacterium griseum]MBC3885939.1 peptidylprolyl isomerase [Undibacterium griseum]
MQIKANTVVSLNYVMYNMDGAVIDRNQDPIVYLHGDYDNILPAVEAALEGKQTGDKISVVLAPEQGFGDIEPDFVREEDISAFPPDIEVGMMFETRDPDTEETMQFRVLKIDAGTVTLDGNHPLAGMTIRFDTEVLDVREASDEEVVHGHVHGAGGHHH